MQPPVFHYPTPVNTDMQVPPPTLRPPAPQHPSTPLQTHQQPPPQPPHLPPPQGASLPPAIGTPQPSADYGPPILPPPAQALLAPPPGAAAPLVPLYHPGQPPMHQFHPQLQQLQQLPPAPPQLYGPPPMSGMPSHLNPALFPAYSRPIPRTVAISEIISPSELATVLPRPHEDLLDRDLARLIDKANKYGGAQPRGHASSHKYEKYTFLAGLLLVNRGLPPVSVADDPNDVYVKLANIYLANPSRLGSNPDVLLAATLAGRRSGRHRHHHHHHHSRRHHHHAHHHSGRERSRSRSLNDDGSNRSDRSGSRRRSSSRGHGSKNSHRSRSRGGSSSTSTSEDWES